MKDLNRWLQWTFWGSLGVFAVAFAFYLVSILIPVLLGIIPVSYTHLTLPTKRT